MVSATRGKKMKIRSRIRSASGLSLLQLIITMAVISIVSAFALISFRSTKASLRLQNSVRQLAGYLEKARLDALRRHANPNSTVVFTSATTYDVTMDFDGT